MSKQLKIEHQYQMSKKSVPLAYLLGALLGGFGAHRFYLRDNTGGCCYLVLLVLSVVIPPFIFGLMLFFIFDFFYTYVMVNKFNDNLKKMIKLSYEDD